MNLGVSQSRAGEVVEKHRDSDWAGEGVVKPAINISQFDAAEEREKIFLIGEGDKHVGLKKAI